MRGYWPTKPIRVIPFLTADRPNPPPAPRQKPATPLRVIYLGRLVDQKRPDQLAKRWPLLTQHPALAGATLDIHGYDPGGGMSREITEFVTQRNFEKRIRVRGEYQLRDLPAIFDSCDLVVLPSLWEGLPLVLVEAMARGVPFVATEAGGTAELGEHNPDVKITSTRWEDFEKGLVTMAGKLLEGAVQPRRLHAWAEQRYGYTVVSSQWLDCLTAPRSFFHLQ
jgi:glycosyltransferase involved in cell wall biosynthesis